MFRLMLFVVDVFVFFYSIAVLEIRHGRTYLSSPSIFKSQFALPAETKPAFFVCH